MKKKVIIGVSVLIVIILLFPIPLRLKDGGTIKYQAILYSVSDTHSLVLDSNDAYQEGIIVEILGFEVYNNVK